MAEGTPVVIISPPSKWFMNRVLIWVELIYLEFDEWVHYFGSLKYQSLIHDQITIWDVGRASSAHLSF